MKDISAKTTAIHLSTFIGDILKRNSLDAKFCAYCMESVFGNEIHKMIDGFINFSKDNNLDMDDIKSTLCHDLGGALSQDKFMLPRVSDYAQYSN
jgi:hypothetical protein